MRSECELCGEIGDVLPRMSWFLEGGYATAVRCRDEVACQRRHEERGIPWPLITNEEARERWPII